MKGKDMLVIAATAAITFAFALAFWTPVRRAVAEQAANDKTPVKPVLKVGDVQITFDLAKKKLALGDKPEGVLTAVNAGAEPVKMTVKLQMMLMSNPGPLTRVGPIAYPVWTHDVEIALDAGETKTVKVAAGAAVAAGTTSFTLTSGDKSIRISGPSIPGLSRGGQFSPSVWQIPAEFKVNPDSTAVPVTPNGGTPVTPPAVKN